MDDKQFRHQVLDKLSPSFCGAKWYNATIWLGSGLTTSCHHPPAHAIDAEAVTRHPPLLHNTPEKKQDRAQMQRGERPRGCEYCWKIEDMDRDAVPDRVYKSKIFAIKDLEHARNLSPEEDVNLRTLEISFDRTCQFACSYCNPAFSSTWARDIHRHGPYQHLVSDGRNHFTHEHADAQRFTINQVNPYVEAFFRWWESDLHQTLDELRITGGEPLMSGYTWRLVDWFRDNPGRSRTRLAINSNLGMEWDTIQRLLDSCRGVELDLYTSNESVGAHAEYIRDGLDWTTWITNLDRVIQSGRVRQVHVMCTINALCLESLPDLLTLILERKSRWGATMPNFTLNILRFPSFQSPLVLPKSYLQKCSLALKQWLDTYYNHSMLQEHEKDHIQRLLDYLSVVDRPHSDSFDRPQLDNDFREFYSQYDQRRGKDFVNTFPHLKDWYNGLRLQQH